MSEEDSQKITVEVVKRYMELDMKIHEMEKRNVRKNFQELQQQLKNAEDELKSCKVVYEESVKKTQLEKADVDKLQRDLQSAVLSKSSYDEQMTKEQEQLVSVMNRLSIYKEPDIGDKNQPVNVMKMMSEYKETDLKEFTGEPVKVTKMMSEYKGADLEEFAGQPVKVTKILSEYKGADLEEFAGEPVKATKMMSEYKGADLEEFKGGPVNVMKMMSEYKGADLEEFKGGPVNVMKMMSEYKGADLEEFKGGPVNVMKMMSEYNGADLEEFKGGPVNVMKMMSEYNEADLGDCKGQPVNGMNRLSVYRGIDWQYAREQAFNIPSGSLSQELEFKNDGIKLYPGLYLRHGSRSQQISSQFFVKANDSGIFSSSLYEKVIPLLCKFIEKEVKSVYQTLGSSVNKLVEEQVKFIYQTLGPSIYKFVKGSDLEDIKEQPVNEMNRLSVYRGIDWLYPNEQAVNIPSGSPSQEIEFKNDSIKLYPGLYSYRGSSIQQISSQNFVRTNDSGIFNSPLYQTVIPLLYTLIEKEVKSVYQTLGSSICNIVEEQVKFVYQTFCLTIYKLVKEQVKFIYQTLGPSLYKLANKQKLSPSIYKLVKKGAEYVEAMSEQETASQNVAKAEEKLKNLRTVVESCRGEYDQLEALIKEHDGILASIFDGKYGSQEENRLEAELEMLLERRQRIEVALYKWQNGKNLLWKAVEQLSTGVKLWITVGKIPITNQQEKYNCTTICRNNFLAAMANIGNCQKYLQNIRFPYCNQDEMLVLNTAVNNIYIDMQTPERHNHAFKCYDTNYRRCAALQQWFGSVITNTIERDLHDAIKKSREAEKLLRKERVRLLKEKIQENGGKFDFGNDDDDDDDAAADAELAKLFEPEQAKCDSLSPGDNKDMMPAPTPMPQSELAPPPSEEDMFGNMEQLKKDHEENMQEWKKTQESNKARMDKGLEEKLAERRMRRQKTSL